MSALISGGGEACRRAEAAFCRCIEENGMEPLLAHGVLLALSGGADSVLLFHLLLGYTRERNIPFAAAHVHHGIRGKEADRDAAFCHDLCNRQNVSFFLCCEDAPAYACGDGKGRGLEYAARRVRYAALDRLMTENPIYGVCATAHNATDNLETVLLHMLRGSGMRGMCGIPPVRDVFVRPLLLLAKRDVLAAVEELGAVYVTDSTNEETAYDRNYIRAEILPRLLPLRADPEAAVSRLCANMREESDVIEEMADSFFADHVQRGTADRAALCALPSAVAFRVISRMCRPFMGDETPERKHAHALLALLAGTRVQGHYSMPGHFDAVFDRNAVFFERQDAGAVAYDLPLVMGQNVLPHGAGEIWLFAERNLEFEKERSNVYNLFIQAKLDSATILGKLSARTRRAGDAYRYGGMTRRVRRLMADAQMPLSLRATLPLVYDEAGIVWVPGFGVRDDDANGEQGGLCAYFLC